MPEHERAERCQHDLILRAKTRLGIHNRRNGPPANDETSSPQEFSA
jgi:hypothetical protein